MESDSDTRSKQQLLVLPAKALELISLFLSLCCGGKGKK